MATAAEGGATDTTTSMDLNFRGMTTSTETQMDAKSSLGPAAHHGGMLLSTLCHVVILTSTNHSLAVAIRGV